MANTFDKNRRQFLKMISMGISTFALTNYRCKSKIESIDEKPNILWITCEDIGPALRCYGDEYAVTPNLDQFAKEGILYRNAFATAPICAPARSCLITGMYATSLGTQHLRSEIPIPDFIKCLPQYLREHGYYCTNNHKTDYNFNPEGVWDENSTEAHWRHRRADQPFFSVFNFGTTHEGKANSLDENIFAGLKVRHDPNQAQLPPYFPDTPEMRRIWARYYDLITVLDGQVGQILQQLDEDGLTESTIIFFFSDHGFGLPRYKRWAHNTGLHVPLIIRIPKKFQYLAKNRPGETNHDLVSFVDFAPTVLSLTSSPIPEHMEGFPFLGHTIAPPRGFVIGARSRADDVYDVCRTVRDKQFIYIRNYMPHLPYIQRALIFSDRKASYKELRRARNEGCLPEAGEALWNPKPVEELYDLQNDPYELNNLTNSSAYQNTLKLMRSRLHHWIQNTRDTGFLHEAEMMIRSENSTPFEMARDTRQYNLSRILDAAELVGNSSIDLTKIIEKLQNVDSGARFWATIALIARGKEAEIAIPALMKALKDDSPSVQIAASEALCHLNHCKTALPILAANLEDAGRPWVVLQAARSIQCIGKKAIPLIALIRKVLKKNSGDVWGRYKNWSYPMFIGFALDQALLNCGEQP